MLMQSYEPILFMGEHDTDKTYCLEEIYWSKNGFKIIIDSTKQEGISLRGESL